MKTTGNFSFAPIVAGRNTRSSRWAPELVIVVTAGGTANVGHVPA
jgi:hypothetical protein